MSTAAKAPARGISMKAVATFILTLIAMFTPAVVILLVFASTSSGATDAGACRTPIGARPQQSQAVYK